MIVGDYARVVGQTCGVNERIDETSMRLVGFLIHNILTLIFLKENGTNVTLYYRFWGSVSYCNRLVRGFSAPFMLALTCVLMSTLWND